MNKNLIKIEGVYNNLKDAQEHNIFCTMLVDFSDFNNILINIKNCEITDIDEFNKNLINFDEQNYKIKDKNIKKILEIIDDLKKGSEGEFSTYLEYLAQFLFQYIYNEYYIEGNYTFLKIKVCK